MTDKIQHHEDWQDVSVQDFRAWHWRQAGNLSQMPSTAQAQGTVDAYINQGRWIAECPIGHGDAVCASESFPFFLCTAGGMAENSGNWYNVRYPANKRAIEQELEKRMAVHPFKAAQARNWKPGETLKDLQDENKAHPERLKPEFR